jgi:hypothetical protein
LVGKSYDDRVNQICRRDDRCRTDVRSATHDIGGKVGMVVATASVQLPGAWRLAAVTVAMFGLVPRLTPAACGVLMGFVALYLLGSLSGAPQRLLDLELFAHIPAGGRRRLHHSSTDVITGDQRDTAQAGSGGLPSPRPADLRRLS